MAESDRRLFLKRAPLRATAAAAAAAVPAVADAAQAGTPPAKRVHWRGGQRPERPPLFSGVVSYGNLLFISGIGAHFPGDIKAHTDHVLNEIEAQLEEAGSSMAQVLKVNVYLNDLADYDGMNEVYQGRFGAEPGVRTTIAAAGGIPGGSLVEIDCIAVIGA
jgi:enamine deaminase RidA (YjgF/YER057c/UK114 family)